MKIAGKDKLLRFIRKHADARKWIENWIADVGSAGWQKPQEIKDRYSTASFLPNNIVIFNVKGRDYRLETGVAYRTGNILVVWIGTHAEYMRRYKKKWV